MAQTFTLAVCAEMVYQDLPFTERMRILDASGFGVEMWDSTAKDLGALEATGIPIVSMTGYLEQSAAILLLSLIPDTFIWLSWQSVLVLATAIYFRSRFIVVTNFTFYIMLLLSYLISASAVGAISLSFGIIALVSARILNIQKHRLEIKTEMLRYTYLGAAFVAFPYALYYTVPEGYVPLAWMGVALFYYIMHRILKSQRYQLMSLLTLILTVLYVAFIGIVRLDPALRIVSFLALGTVLLSVSIIYSKIRRSQRGPKEAPQH